MSQPQHLRQLNRRQILTLLFEHGRLTRPHLAELTGLSKVTVNAVVQDLVEQAAVQLSAGTSSTPGRVPCAVELHPLLATVLAIDLQSSHLRAQVHGLALQEPQHLRLETGPDDLTTLTARLIRELHASPPFGPLRSVVIGLPAPVDDLGQVGEPNALPWLDVPRLRVLARELTFDLRFENDANLVTLALHARAPEYTHFAALIERPSGTGLGLMLGGQLYRGVHGRAGELGRSPWPGHNTAGWEVLEQLPDTERLDATAFMLAALMHTLDLEHLVLSLRPGRMPLLERRLRGLLPPAVTLGTEPHVSRAALHGGGLCALKRARDRLLGSPGEEHVA
jgi:hypothetical protein